MPGKVKVKIIAGRNLPVMDRSSDTTDAYVEIKLGNTTFKTDVCRKSLHPQWNSEWYRFEVDDSELQDEPLQIRLMDHDTYSANDAIGKIYLDLNPLLIPATGKLFVCRESINHEPCMMNGWIPVYDTMHGIRGEVNIIVKVELFSDFNRFRQSSCGVQCFYSSTIPHGYIAQNIHGFVEELIVNDDPEYQWIDKIRTPRASNEARQTLFLKLSGELQRKIGVKTLDLGGNAVVGYNQCFDLEGESGIVARGFGTAVTLIKVMEQPQAHVSEHSNEERAQNYLKFLNANASFHLSCAPVVTSPIIPIPKQISSSIFVTKLPNLDFSNPRYKQISKLSKTDTRFTRSNPTLSSESHSLQTLLKQEDLRGTQYNYGISKTIKKIKLNSQNILSKKMTALKAKLGDTGIGERLDDDDKDNRKSKPIQSGHMNKTIKEKNTEPSVMAELLVRTVIHAQNSLSSILETQDADSNHDNSANHDIEIEDSNDALEELRPIVNLLEKTKSELYFIDDKQFIETQSFNDLSSNSEFESSNDEEDNDDDDEDEDDDDDENFNVKETAFDTISDIVKNVEIIQYNYDPKHLAKQFSLPVMPFQLVDENEGNGEKSVKASGEKSDNLMQIQQRNIILINDNLKSKEFNEQQNKNICKIETIDQLSNDNLANVDDNNLKNMEEISNIESSQMINFGPFKPPRKHIIPPVKIDVISTKPQSLIRTAMQTILLDKVNIIGTYTSPSPSSVSMSLLIDNNNDVKASQRSFNATPSTSQVSSETAFVEKDVYLSSSLGELPRSKAKTLLNDCKNKSYETVLGVHFSSLNNLKRQLSHTCVFPNNDDEINKSMCDKQIRYSDSQLNANELKTQLSSNLKQNKVHFTKLLDKNNFTNNNNDGKMYKFNDNTNIIDQQTDNKTMSKLNLIKINQKNNNTNENVNNSKNKFGFFYWKRNKSNNNNANLIKTKCKTKSIDYLNRIIKMFQNKSKSIENLQKDNDETLKKHGLLGTALGNVVMETVQDILATSHADKDQKQSNSNPETHTLALLSQQQQQPFAPSCSNNTINFLKTTLNTNNDDTSCVGVSINTEIDGKNTKPNSDDNNKMHASLTPSLRNTPPDSNIQQHHQIEVGPHPRTESVGSKTVYSPAKINTIPCIHRRSSDSDLSITPKGNSFTAGSSGAGSSTGNYMKTNILKMHTSIPKDFDMLEYPFLTMSKYPLNFIMHLGGTVSARSVKLLERISNSEEPESRDTWWSEIRMEIRSHARILNCNAVLGYAENTTLCEGLCVLSASGTAAVVCFHHTNEINDELLRHSNNGREAIPCTNLQKDKFRAVTDSPEQQPKQQIQTFDLNNLPQYPCIVCHLPYNINNVPIKSTVSKCRMCNIQKVPEILLTTIEASDGMPIVGRGCFIQSFVCRQLKETKSSEADAKEISDGLPFLEYELQRLLVNKLKIKGMNAIFNLKIRLSVSERILVGIATGTAVFMAPLPTPIVPKLVSDRSTNGKKLADLQKLLNDYCKRNKEIYQLKLVDDINENLLSDDDSDEETSLPKHNPHHPTHHIHQTPIDITMANKDFCVLEVDDPEDAEVVKLLLEELPPNGFHVVNTEYVPGLEELEIVKNLQMFVQIYRPKIQPPYNFDEHFRRLLQSVYFKLRRMVPCALCNLQFRIDLPEPDEIQLCVLGMAVGLGDPSNIREKKETTPIKKNEDELIFNMEKDPVTDSGLMLQLNTQSLKDRQKSPLRKIQMKHHMPCVERYGVDITPLSYIPGGKIERYLGNLNFFFIRETTSIREEGGSSGFLHSFITEVLAIVRAHVTALGGNAMVAYFMTECFLNHNLHKNQGQCLLNVGGDVVFVSYFKDDI